MPWEDPNERDLFGGDDWEMSVAAGFNKGLRDLRSRVEASRKEAGYGRSPEADGADADGERPPPPKGGAERKKKTAEAKKAAVAAAAAKATQGA